MPKPVLRTLHPSPAQEDLVSPAQQLAWVVRRLRQLEAANAALTGQVEQLSKTQAVLVDRIQQLEADNTALRAVSSALAAPFQKPAPSAKPSHPQPPISGKPPAQPKKRPTLAPYQFDYGVFGNPKLDREQITYVVFLDTLSGAPVDAWDVSLQRDGSALAWAERDGEGLRLCIAGESGVSANRNSSMLFAGYVSLVSIDFGRCFDTSGVTNMREMFNCCLSLTDLDLSCFDTAQVTDMSWMFAGCSALARLNLSGFDTAQVTNMSHLFSECEQLTSLDLSGFDTARVTDMSDLFFGCDSLSALDLSGFDTAQVTDMSDMFGECRSLTALDLSSFDTAQVTSMKRMFAGCTQLASLQLSDFSTENVTGLLSKSRMFANCRSLTADTQRSLRSRNLPV